MRNFKPKKSSLDTYLNQVSGESTDNSPTLKDERREAEKKAVDFNNMRKAQVEAFPNAAPSEYKEGFRDEVSDEPQLVEKASKTLKDYLNRDLRCGGGVEITLDEFRSGKSRRDMVDNSIINDSALISFTASFATPTKNKRVAKFVVAYDYNNDKKYSVEPIFFDQNESEYELSSENLEQFLKNAESEIMPENKEIPLVCYNYEHEGYETIETPESTDKVVARLKANGFNINKTYIDACYGPKEYGKICYEAVVPSKDMAAFKKIATAVPDSEWFDRSLEKGGHKGGSEKWTERALESGSYSKKGEGDSWPERALEGGKEGKGKDYGNPYGSDAKMMAADASKKRREAVKKALDKKDNTKKDILTRIDELDNLTK